jgi:hypothetical protein
MHENRETSEAPAGNSSRAAGEGLGRKARMNVPDELGIAATLIAAMSELSPDPLTQRPTTAETSVF